jgi:hypothetical protein
MNYYDYFEFKHASLYLDALKGDQDCEEPESQG